MSGLSAAETATAQDRRKTYRSRAEQQQRRGFWDLQRLDVIDADSVYSRKLNAAEVRKLMKSAVAIVNPLFVVLTVPLPSTKPVTAKSTLPLPKLAGPMTVLSRLNSLLTCRQWRRYRRGYYKGVMKIPVKSVAPGSLPETVDCTSNHAFLVYGVTNGGGDYSVSVKSTGAGMGVRSPTFVVGGPANDVVTLIIQPGTTGFLTCRPTTARGRTFRSGAS